MITISIDYKKADISKRSAFSIGTEAVLEMLEQLRKEGAQAVFLSTCNRAELYAGCDSERAFSILSDYTHVDLDEIENLAQLYEDNEAIVHLFRVCAGLESMVLGEDEILGQMKAAYALSRENGSTDFYFNTVFQAAFSCAKRIKTETYLSKSSVSVATIAALICHNFKKEKKNVLIAGATSEIGRKLVKNLISYGDFDIKATRRNSAVMEEEVETVPFEARYEYTDEADIIISCTKSPHYIFSANKLEKAFETKKQRLFIDLAVPKDIDPAVADFSDARLITIDEISEHARENNERKKSEALKAKAMIAESVDELLKTIHYRDFVPAFNRLKEELAGDFSKFVYRYRDLATFEEFMSFLDIVKRMEDGE